MKVVLSETQLEKLTQEIGIVSANKHRTDYMCEFEELVQACLVTQCVGVVSHTAQVEHVGNVPTLVFAFTDNDGLPDTERVIAVGVLHFG